MTTRFQQVAACWVSAGAIVVAAASQAPADAVTTWRQAAQSTAIDAATSTRIEQLTRDHVTRTAVVRPAEGPPLTLVVMTAAASTSQPLTDAAQQTLSRYAEWLGPLRIDRLTIVELPGHLDLAAASYPGIAATRSRWLTGRREFAIERDMAAAIARQYAAMLVSGPGGESWFADGLAAYLATRPLELRFEPRPALTPRYFGGFVPHSIRALSTSAVHPRPSLSDLAGFFETGDAPWTLTRVADRERARRFAISLQTLERFIGWPALQATLQAFMQRHQAGTPLLQGFVDVAAQQRGDDIGWFFNQSMRTDAQFDYAIVNVTTTAAAGGWRTTVDVRRVGEATFDGTSLSRAALTARSLPVVTKFSDGSEIIEWIDGRDREWQFRYVSVSPATLASIDPEAILLLEADRTNNTRTVNPSMHRAGLRLALNWLSWLQDAMLACTAVI